MKKAIKGLFLVLCSGILCNSLTAQCTADTTIKIPGFYPATFPDADKDKPYTATTTVLSVKDTNVFGQVVLIDSTVLKAVVGLPAGITYQCLNNKCVFLPSKPSCVVFFGNTHPSGYLSVENGCYDLCKNRRCYPIQQSGHLENVFYQSKRHEWYSALDRTAQFSISPNPVENQLHVYVAQDSHPSIISITDAMGRVLQVEHRESEENVVSINTSNLLPGVYFCSNGLISKRFIKL